MTKSLKKLVQHLTHLKNRNLYRSLEIPSKSLIDFCSNDYLGFSKNLKIKKEFISRLKKVPSIGAGSSRLIRGNTTNHESIEEELSDFVQRERTLVFSSGYLANVGLLASLCKGASVFSDELNHASLIDGIRLSGSRAQVYSHRCVKDLERKMRKVNSRDQKVIVTESLFSMDGDFAPLSELLWLSKKYNAFLYVDEAHTTGVFGKKGEGCLAEMIKKDTHFFKKFSSDLLISVHTFGKSFGLGGAFVACSKLLKEFFINQCRTFIYTTGVSPLLVLSWRVSLKALKKETSKIKSLQEKAFFFRKSLKEMGLRTSSESQIIPILLGSSKRALLWEKTLKRKGFDVRAIRYPTVKKGTARLRICIHEGHKKRDMILILKCLREMKEKRKIKLK